MDKKESFKEFEGRARHPKDSLFANLFLNPITIRIAYFIKKYNLNITPNQVTYFRLLILSPMIIFLLFLAPILKVKIVYLLVAILFYFILITDWLDGAIARGLNKTSKKGEFLDSIADRTGIIIFFVLIISIGMWMQNFFLICGGISLFVIKTFNLMVISKIFYYGATPSTQKVSTPTERYKDKNMLKIFGGEDSNKMGMGKVVSFLDKINKYLKIKRWNPKILQPEIYFLTIITPSLLIFFGLKTITVYFLGMFIIAYIFFFIRRIINLFGSYL